MHLIALACDTAQAVASACAHATAFPPAPSIQEYGNQVHHAARSLIVSYLEVGPVAWLSLLVVGWVLWRVVVGRVGTALWLWISPVKRESTYVVVRGTPRRRRKEKSR